MLCLDCRNLISCSALRADGYEKIFPDPEKGKVYLSGIYKCKEGEDSEETAIPIVQIANLFFVCHFSSIHVKDLSWSRL